MKYSINDTTLTAIGNAIREKNGATDTYTPEEMATAISAITTGGGSGDGENKLAQLIGRHIAAVTVSDLVGLTSIGAYAFCQCTNLSSLELPGTVINIESNAFNGALLLKQLTLPVSVEKINYLAFSGSSIVTLTILKEDDLIQTIAYGNTQGAIPSYGKGVISEIRVSGKLCDDYRNSTNWAELQSTFVPYDEYVGTPVPDTILAELNEPTTIEFPFSNFDYTPEVNYTIGGSLSEGESTVSADSFTIEVTPYEVGLHPIELQVTRADGYVFTRTVNVNAIAEVVESSYEVLQPSDITSGDYGDYGFELNADGYYESTNKGKGSSYAYAKINISNPSGFPVYIDVINYAEASYDYGVLSKVNKELANVASTTTTLDVSAIQHNLKTKNSADVQTFTYLDAIGDCFITVKFIKDGSGNKNNDSMQFKVRFE